MSRTPFSLPDVDESIYYYGLSIVPQIEIPLDRVVMAFFFSPDSRKLLCLATKVNVFFGVQGLHLRRRFELTASGSSVVFYDIIWCHLYARLVSPLCPSDVEERAGRGEEFHEARISAEGKCSMFHCLISWGGGGVLNCCLP